MTKLSPYIYSNHARTQAAFYAKALGGTIVDVRTFGDMPGAKPEDKDRVMHLVLKIDAETIFMADSNASNQRGANLDLTLEYATSAEGQAAFEALSENGEILMPFQKMFWGTDFGRLEDQFGIHWQISAGS